MGKPMGPDFLKVRDRIVHFGRQEGAALAAGDRNVASATGGEPPQDGEGGRQGGRGRGIHRHVSSFPHEI